MGCVGDRFQSHLTWRSHRKEWKPWKEVMAIVVCEHCRETVNLWIQGAKTLWTGVTESLKPPRKSSWSEILWEIKTVKPAVCRVGVHSCKKDKSMGVECTAWWQQLIKLHCIFKSWKKSQSYKFLSREKKCNCVWCQVSSRIITVTILWYIQILN